jgi:hypothetical protein
MKSALSSIMVRRCSAKCVLKVAAGNEVRRVSGSSARNKRPKEPPVPMVEGVIALRSFLLLWLRLGVGIMLPPGARLESSGRLDFLC